MTTLRLIITPSSAISYHRHSILIFVHVYTILTLCSNLVAKFAKFTSSFANKLWKELLNINSESLEDGQAHCWHDNYSITQVEDTRTCGSVASPLEMNN